MDPQFMHQMPLIAPVWAEVFLALSALFLLTIGSFRGNSFTRGISYLSLISLIATFFLIVFTDRDFFISCNGMFLSNAYVNYAKGLLCLVVIFVLFMTMRAIERDDMKRFEYPILILLATLGMMIILSASDLIALFLGMEMMSLSLYILVSLDRDHGPSSEAGMKYFILGALGTAFFLYGASFLYGYGGATDFARLGVAFQGATLSGPLVIGVGFVFVSFALKLSLAPFHMWAPDVYQGSPTVVTAFLASAPKIAIFALVIRLTATVFDPFSDLILQIVMVLSFVSMGWGAVAALSQTSIKRVLAYSTVSHMGYGFLGLLGSNGSGIESCLLYITLYAVQTVGIFACLLNIRRHGRTLDHLDDFNGLGIQHPWIAGFLTLFLFSLAGVPPLAGFFAKLAVFQDAVQGGYIPLAIFGVITSVVSAFYYLSIIKRLYFGGAADGALPSNVDGDICRETFFVMTMSGAIVLFYIVFPGFFMGMIAHGTASLRAMASFHILP